MVVLWVFGGIMDLGGDMAEEKILLRAFALASQQLW